MASIYQQVIEAGIEHDHHESDLYIPVNDQTKKIVHSYEFKRNVTMFASKIDGKPWFNIPFAFQPFWDSKQTGKRP